MAPAVIEAAFARWYVPGLGTRETLLHAFDNGWADAKDRRGDFRRRLYAGNARAAYLAGRAAAHRDLQEATA